jgi:hypothetical protein
LADGVGQLVADPEPDAGCVAVGRERVRPLADIGPDQHLPFQVLGSDLRQRQAEHGEVILRGVRSRVPGRRIAANGSPVSSSQQPSG